jgi:hypothetical protein
MVATAGSLIEQLFPKSIHAVTSQGFELKVTLLVIAYSLHCYLHRPGNRWGKVSRIWCAYAGCWLRGFTP